MFRTFVIQRPRSHCRISEKALRILEVESNLWQPTVKILHRFDTIIAESDGQTDRQTHTQRQTDAKTIAKTREALHFVAIF